MLVQKYGRGEVITPSVPGTNTPNFQAPKLIVEDGVAYPTILGTFTRDYGQSGYVIDRGYRPY